jgi:hypothetical protein
MQGLSERSNSYIVLFANAGSLLGMGWGSLNVPQQVVWILLAALKTLMMTLSDNETINVII